MSLWRACILICPGVSTFLYIMNTSTLSLSIHYWVGQEYVLIQYYWIWMSNKVNPSAICLVSPCWDGEAAVDWENAPSQGLKDEREAGCVQIIAAHCINTLIFPLLQLTVCPSSLPCWCTPLHLCSACTRPLFCFDHSSAYLTLRPAPPPSSLPGGETGVQLSCISDLIDLYVNRQIQKT